MIRDYSFSKAFGFVPNLFSVANFVNTPQEFPLAAEQHKTQAWVRQTNTEEDMVKSIQNMIVHNTKSVYLHIKFAGTYRI